MTEEIMKIPFLAFLCTNQIKQEQRQQRINAQPVGTLGDSKDDT